MIWRTPPYFSPSCVVLDAGGGYAVSATVPLAEQGCVFVHIALIEDEDPEEGIFVDSCWASTGKLRPGESWQWTDPVPEEFWFVVRKATWLVWNLNHRI